MRLLKSRDIVSRWLQREQSWPLAAFESQTRNLLNNKSLSAFTADLQWMSAFTVGMHSVYTITAPISGRVPVRGDAACLPAKARLFCLGSSLGTLSWWRAVGSVPGAQLCGNRQSAGTRREAAPLLTRLPPREGRRDVERSRALQRKSCLSLGPASVFSAAGGKLWSVLGAGSPSLQWDCA